MIAIRPADDKELFFSKAEEAHGVFCSKKWLSVYGPELQLMGIYSESQQMLGGFFYLNTKKYGFTFIKLPPYTPHCGLFFAVNSSNKSSQHNFVKEIMAEVCAYFDALKPALLILAFPSNITDLQPFIWSKYKVVPNYTYHIPLEQSVQDIVSHFDSKNRNVINKAVKEGVEVKLNDIASDQLFTFFNSSLLTAGANVYQDELKGVFANTCGSNAAFSVSAWHKDKLLGIVYCVLDKSNCYYLLGGTDRSAGINGINNLLVLKSIEQAKERGCTVFDFEGSMLKGVERFFRSFGPDLVPYYTINKAKLPLEILLKFKKREIF